MTIKGFELKYTDEQIDSITAEMAEVLRSGMICANVKVQEVERLAKEQLGTKYAIGVSCGTDALEMCAQWAFKEIYTDELQFPPKILVPTNTFFATSEAMTKGMFRVEFVDMEYDYLGMDLIEAKRLIELDPEIRAVCVVHIGGYVNPMLQPFAKWCRNRGVYVIEDCAHAYGSKHAGEWGDVAGWSFFATKVFTGGEGGLVTTNSGQTSKYLHLVRNFGKPNPWESFHIERGYNYRMSEFNACVLLNQLRRFDSIMNRRKEILRLYEDNLFEHLNIRYMYDSSIYKIVMIDEQIALVKDALNEAGITLAGGVYNTPLHKMPVYSEWDGASFPKAEWFADHHIALPIHLELTDDDVLKICEVIMNEIEGEKK